MSSRARGLACAAGCGATAVALHRLRAALPSPPMGAWADATEWYDAAGPSTATMALLRVIALVLCSWIAVACTLQVAASMRTSPSMQRVADTISPGWLRRLGRGMAGVSLSAGLALSATGAALGTPAGGSVTPVGVSDPEPVQDADGVAIMRTVQDTGADSIGEDSGGVATMRPLPDAAGEASSTPAAAPTSGPPASTYVVASGDSCWSVAAELLRDVHGTEPDERAIWEAWSELIELNRPRFATGDPDLLFPGQELVLPDLGR